MPSFTYDPSKSGLKKIHKDYEILALKHAWANYDKGIGSNEAHYYVNQKLGQNKKISRASIIQFLNTMADEGVLNAIERPGKGGMRRIYFPVYNEEQYNQYIINKIISSLLEDFPENVRIAIKELKIIKEKKVKRDNSKIKYENKKELKDLFRVK